MEIGKPAHFDEFVIHVVVVLSLIVITTTKLILAMVRMLAKIT